MTEALNLDECWDDLRSTSERPICRPRVLAVDWTPPPPKDVTDWFEALAETVYLPELSSRVMAVQAPSHAHRALVYGLVDAEVKSPDAWLVKGVHAHFSDQIAKLLGNWGTLWGIIDADNLAVEEPLHGLIDQGFRFTELFQAIWEIRFMLSEGKDPRDLVHALTAWLANKQLDVKQRNLLRKAHVTHELATPQEQLDVLFFMTALAQQNGVLGSAVIAFDGLDRALGQAPSPRRVLLRDLDALIRSCERWARLGSPLGLMIGFGSDTMDTLKQSHAKLHQKIVTAPLV